jgi:hypothetical protein
LAARVDPVLISRLRGAVPQLHEWLLTYTSASADRATSVASLSIPNLAKCYPSELLESTRVLFEDEVCYPPLERFGLEEFQSLHETSWSGITFNNLYCLKHDVASSPALHFHELVHVLQYRRLGIEQFLWAYSIGIALHGYENSPLEKMAYDLQLEFEHGIYRRSLTADIERRTDVIWKAVCQEAGHWCAEADSKSLARPS